MGIRQKIIETYKELRPLARYELLDIIHSMKGEHIERDQALVSFLYLTGCRIEEVCKYIVPNKNGLNIYKGFPIQKKQVTSREGVVIIQNVRCLKRKKELRRNIPIIINDLDNKFLSLLLNYVLKLQEEDYLFNIGRVRAYQILSKVGLFPHYLRHIRLTHLVTDYGFSDAHLKQFTGWSDGRPASVYTHLNVENLIKQMKG